MLLFTTSSRKRSASVHHELVGIERNTFIGFFDSSLTEAASDKTISVRIEMKSSENQK